MKLFAPCALAVLMWATPAAADEPAEVAHGAGQGRGDSRGAGDGDGQGDADRLATAADAEPPRDAADDELLGFDVGGGVRMVPRLQYRFRYYHDDGHDFVTGNTSDFVRQRARLGLEAHYQRWASAFVQLQDVRRWGEELDPARDQSADGFDLHQGWLRFGKPGSAASVTVGRQELSYLNGRLIAKGDFSEQGRSFDAGRLNLQRGGAVFDSAWALVRDYQPDDVGSEGEFGKRHLGVWHIGHPRLTKALQPHVLVVYEGDTASRLGRVTMGSLLQGRIGNSLFLDWSAEGYFQYGQQDPGLTYVASLLSTKTRLGADYGLGLAYVELEATFVSGDEDPDDDVIKTFTAPYPAAHEFHGEMDFFTRLPRDTQGRGLRDFGAALGIKPQHNELRVGFHFFDSNVDREDDLSHFGWELDISMKGRYADDHFGLELLYALFGPGDLLTPASSELGVEQGAYVTLDATF